MSDDEDFDDDLDDEVDGNTIDDADLDDDDDDLDEDDDPNTVDGNSYRLGTAIAVCEYLTRAIVSDPAGVEVTVHEGGGRAELQVTVSDGDMGRVIGRRGRVAKAIRTVVRAAADRDGADVDVEFID